MAYVRVQGLFDNIGAGLKDIATTFTSPTAYETAASQYAAQQQAAQAMPTWEKLAIGGGVALGVYMLFFRKKR